MIYIHQPLSSVGLFTLAALIDCGEAVYYGTPRDKELSHNLIKKINPTAIEYSGRVDLMSAVLLEGEDDDSSIEGLENAPFVLRIVEQGQVPPGALQCTLQVPCLYQQLRHLPLSSNDDSQQAVEAIDAEDVAIAAATLLSQHKWRHQRTPQHYRLRGHHISAEYLAAIRERLPVNPLDSQVVKRAVAGGENDLGKLVLGQEAGSVEEFLKKCEGSLYHQRFLGIR